MIKIGKAVLGKSPAIAITLADSESLHLIQKAKRTVGTYCDTPLLLEIRIDRFRKLKIDSIISRLQLLRRAKLPLIATVRSRKEGGRRFIPEAKRLELFQAVLPHVDAIDVELSSPHLIKTLVPLAKRKGKRTILSYHHFKATPPDAQLIRLIQKGKKRGADIVKIAVTPQRSGDVGRLLLLTKRFRGKGLITIAMGPLGRASRILAPLFGSALTYTFIRKPQAPGQIPLGKLSKQLRAFFQL